MEIREHEDLNFRYQIFLKVISLSCQFFFFSLESLKLTLVWASGMRKLQIEWPYFDDQKLELAK